MNRRSDFGWVPGAPLLPMPSSHRHSSSADDLNASSRPQRATPNRQPYRDFSNTSTPEIIRILAGEPTKVPARKRAPSRSRFPILLHHILEQTKDGTFQDIVAWSPHGRSFQIFNRERFASDVMPAFFRHNSQFTSFQRQLNLYGFLRVNRKGDDHGAYYHELFLRGRPHLCEHIHRQRINGNKVRQSTDLELEPWFDQLPPVGLGDEEQTKLTQAQAGDTSPGSLIDLLSTQKQDQKLPAMAVSNTLASLPAASTTAAEETPAPWGSVGSGYIPVSQSVGIAASFNAYPPASMIGVADRHQTEAAMVQHASMDHQLSQTAAMADTSSSWATTPSVHFQQPSQNIAASSSNNFHVSGALGGRLHGANTYDPYSDAPSPGRRKRRRTQKKSPRLGGGKRGDVDRASDQRLDEGLVNEPTEEIASMANFLEDVDLDEEDETRDH